MKHKLSISLALCSLAICLICSRCKDKNKMPDPITVVYTLGDLKDYFYFKAGTYWIYENDVTGEIDSQWVRGSRLSWGTQQGIEEHSKHITLKQETFWVDVYSNFTSGWGSQARWEYWAMGNSVDAFPFPLRAYNVEKRKIFRGNMVDVIQAKVAYHNWNLCKTNNCEPNLDSTLINYSLKGFVYDTVRVFKIGRDGITQDSKFVKQNGPSWYYYAKNVGIIKIYTDSYKVTDNSPYKASWNLIRYKIVQ